MKKYFMKETSEEVKFGDTIVLEFTKNVKGRTIHHCYECRFIPELVPVLLENDIIEEKEITKDNIIHEVIKAHEELELKVEKLEEAFNVLLSQLHNPCNKKNAKKNCRE